MRSPSSMDIQALPIAISRPSQDAFARARAEPVEQQERDTRKREAPAAPQDTRSTAEKLEAATRNEKVSARFFQEEISARAYGAIQTFENIRHYDPQDSIIDTYA